MIANLVTPSVGRGAWPNSGQGGTLDPAGVKPGGFYAAPAPGARMIGKAGYDAERFGQSISVNDYAPFAATRAIQTQLRITADGLYGKDTAAAVATYQKQAGLVADGVFGPNTAKAMWAPLVLRAMEAWTREFPVASLKVICFGTIGVESGWDASAVGVSTPQDLGIGQINGPSHPSITAQERLNPPQAIPYLVGLVRANLANMNGVVRDAIAAYNLGSGGATTWVKQGRPDTLSRIVNGKSVTIRVRDYIDKIIESGTP